MDMLEVKLYFDVACFAQYTDIMGRAYKLIKRKCIL
jgi:hypothetical protein